MWGGQCGREGGGLCAKRKNSLVSPIYSLNAAGHLQNLHNLLLFFNQENIYLIRPCCWLNLTTHTRILTGIHNEFLRCGPQDILCCYYID